MNTPSFFGGPLDLGPCNVYWDTATGGQNIDLGGVDSATLRFGSEVTDLNKAQAGTRRADAVVTASYCEIEFGLAEATLERMDATISGFEVNRNTGGDIVGFSFGPAIGLRHSSIQKQMRLVRVLDGVESTNPLDELVVFRAAITPGVELTYDSASQRFMGMTVEAYRDPNQISLTGRQLFFGGGVFN